MNYNSWDPATNESGAGGESGATTTTGAIPLMTASSTLPNYINVHGGIVLFTIPTTFYPNIGSVYNIQIWGNISALVWGTVPSALNATVALNVSYGPYNGDTSNHNNLISSVIGGYSYTDFGPDGTASGLYNEGTITASFVATSANNNTVGNQLRLMMFNYSNDGIVGINTNYQIYNMTITEVATSVSKTFTSTNYHT